MIKKKRGICKILIFLSALFMLYQLSVYYDIYLKETKEKTSIQTWKQLQFQEQIFIRNRYINYYKYNYYNLLPNLSTNCIEKTPVLTASGWGIENSPQAEAAAKTKAPSISRKAKGADCVLSIPDIGLEKIVYTGKNRELHLDNYELITADINMRYTNGGNYIICGHASRLYGHSLNRLKEVKTGTEIQIKTETQTDIYIVNKVNYENMYNTSQYCNQTKQRSITIISCAKYITEESYIVIHAAPKR